MDNHTFGSINLLHLNQIRNRATTSTAPIAHPVDEFLKAEYTDAGHEDYFTCLTYAAPDEQQSLGVSGHHQQQSIGLDADSPPTFAILPAAPGFPTQHATCNSSTQTPQITDAALALPAAIHHPSPAPQQSVNGSLPLAVPLAPPPTNACQQIDRICRCCLSTQRDLQPIFDTENCIPDMIMALAGNVQLHAADTLPAQICMPCVLQLSRALSFKQQLETADAALRLFVAGGGKLPAALDADADVVLGVVPVAERGAVEVVAGGGGREQEQAGGEGELVMLEQNIHHPTVEMSPMQAASDAQSAAIFTQTSTATLLSTTNHSSNNTSTDSLIAHVLLAGEHDAGLDEDFIKLADPCGGPATLDTMQNLQLLDPSAEVQPSSSGNSVAPSLDSSESTLGLLVHPGCNDSESLLQPMADQPRTLPLGMMLTVNGDGVEEEQEEDYADVDEEEDDDDYDDGDDDDDEVIEIDALEVEPLTTEALAPDLQPQQPLQYMEDEDYLEQSEPPPSAVSSPTEFQAVAPTRWSCFVCQKELADAARLRRHLRTHDPDKQHRCLVCHKSFLLRTELQRHQKRHVHQRTAAQVVAQHQCADCPMSFNLAADLRVHRSLHADSLAGGGFACAGCDKLCDSLVKLRRHIRIHFEDMPHKCAVCDKGFPERGSLTRHFRKHTDDVREKKHQCLECGKRYFDTHALNIHRRTHTGERPWQCTQCPKSFSDSRLLKSHQKVHSAERSYACDMCDRSFTHASTLKSHQRTHTGDRRYVCPECGKSFIQSSNMMLHMRSHSGERPYGCDQCDRQFASSSTLRMHRRVHSGEKPYACEVCNRKFARCDLSAHMRTHTGEKPFPCATCDRRFATSSQLSQHVRSHTGERRHICSECGKACSSASYLRKHQARHLADGQQQQQQPQLTPTDRGDPPSTSGFVLEPHPQQFQPTMHTQTSATSASTTNTHQFDSMTLLGGDVDDALTEAIHLPHIDVLHELSAADAAIVMAEAESKPPPIADDSNGQKCSSVHQLPSGRSAAVVGEAIVSGDGSIYHVIDPSTVCIRPRHQQLHRQHPQHHQSL